MSSDSTSPPGLRVSASVRSTIPLFEHENDHLFCSNGGCANSDTELLSARFAVTIVLGCYGGDVTDPTSDTEVDDYPVTATCLLCGSPATQRQVPVPGSAYDYSCDCSDPAHRYTTRS